METSTTDSPSGPGHILQPLLSGALLGGALFCYWHQMKGAWPTGDGIGAGGGSGANASMVVTPLARGVHLLGANGTDGVAKGVGGKDLPLPVNHLRSLGSRPHQVER